MYEWILALHIIAVIAWMAGLLYLPRLFVYHADAPAGSEMSETFKIMERRLLRAIMVPAMIASWLFGVWLIVLTNAFSEGWLHGKLLMVVLLSAVHMAMVVWRKDLERETNAKSAKYFRIVNEAPTILMIIIVILVVVKPF